MSPPKASASRGAAARPYHHGDLRATLLRLAMEVLERDGVEGLTLRALAREAGISHAAPKHHFDDLAGLLSEVAAVGYGRLADALEQAAQSAQGDTRARMVALGRAYVAQAHDHPGMFRLMFRNACLDFSRPALREASTRSRAVMLRALAARRLAGTDATQPCGEAAAEVAFVAAWSLVHGFAVLLTDGRLEHAVQDAGGDWECLLDGVFGSSR